MSDEAVLREHGTLLHNADTEMQKASGAPGLHWNFSSGQNQGKNAQKWLCTSN